MAKNNNNNNGKITHPILYNQNKDKNPDKTDYVKIFDSSTGGFHKFEGAEDQIENAIQNGLTEITLKSTDAAQKNIVAKIEMSLKNPKDGWKDNNGNIRFENIEMNTAHIIENVKNALGQQIQKTVETYIQHYDKEIKMWEHNLSTPIRYTITDREGRMLKNNRNQNNAINVGYGNAKYVKPNYPQRNIVPQAQIDANQQLQDISTDPHATILKNNYRGTTKKIFDDVVNNQKVAIYDTETFGSDNVPTQLAFDYEGTKKEILMKLTEKETKRLKSLINKVQKSISTTGSFQGTEQEIRDLWNLTDYFEDDIGDVKVKHNNSIHDQKIDNSVLNKMKKGLSLIGADSTAKNIRSQQEAIKEFVEMFGTNLDNIVFSGTNITGFDNKILKDLISKYNVSVSDADKITGNIKSVDILDAIKYMAPVGTRNKKGDFLLSNKIESIGKWLGVDIEKYAEKQNGTQHGALFDVGYEREVYEKLRQEMSNGNIVPPKMDDKQLKKDSYFTARGSTWRDNSYTYKTDSKGNLVTGDFADLLFKKGGLYSFSGYKENPTGQKYAQFQDEISGEGIYLAYDDISEIEKIISKVSNGNLVDKYSKESNLSKKKSNTAISQLFDAKTGTRILESYKKLNNGEDITDYYKNIIDILKDVKIKDNTGKDITLLEEVNSLLENTDYNNLSGSVKGMVLEEFGRNLGLSKSKYQSDSEIFREASKGVNTVGSLKQNFKEYINKHLKAGHFEKGKGQDLLSALKQINLRDEDIRQGATEFYGLASMINNSFSDEYRQDVDIGGIFGNGQISPETRYSQMEQQAQFLKNTVEDKIQEFGTKDNKISRTRRLFNNSTEQIKDALSGQHLIKFLDAIGRRQKAQDSGLMHKDFGKQDQFSFGSAGYYLEKIESLANDMGIGMQLALDEMGNNLRVGFFDQSKFPEITSIDENGNRIFNWDKSANYTFGLAKNDGSIRLGGVDKANYLNIYDEKNSSFRGARLQTAQEAQFAKIYNLLSRDGAGKKRFSEGIFNGDLTDVNKLLSFEARSVLDTAASINPYSTAFDNYDEADSQTTRGTPELTRSRQMIAHLSHFLQPRIRAEVEKDKGKSDFEKAKDYDKKFVQSLERIFLESKGMGDYVSEQDDYKWMSGDFEKELKKIASLGFDLSPLKEESFMQGMLSLGGSSLFDPFAFVIPGYTRLQQQTENRAKKTQSAIKANNGVMKNYIGSKRGQNLGIDYQGEAYENFISAYITDEDILTAYREFFNKGNVNNGNISETLKKQFKEYHDAGLDKNDEKDQIQWIKDHVLLPSVYEDSALIRRSTLSDLGDVKKTRERAFSEKDFEKAFHQTLEEGQFIEGQNLEALIRASKGELKDYLKDGETIKSIVKKDGQYYVSSEYREKLESGFKGFTGDKNTFEVVDDVIADILNDQLGGYSETTGNGKIHLFKKKEPQSARKPYSQIAGRYRYLINQALKEKINGGMSSKEAVKEVYQAISGLNSENGVPSVLSQLFSFDEKSDEMLFENSNFDVQEFVNKSSNPETARKALENYLSLKDSDILETALFGKVEKQRSGRYASKLNAIDEYKWFNPVGSGDKAYVEKNSHVTMTHRGTEALNRLINAVRGVTVGDNAPQRLQYLKAFEEYTKPYFYAEGTESINKDIENTELALQHMTSARAINRDALEKNAIVIDDLSEIVGMANSLEMDENGVSNWQDSAMAILRKKAEEKVKGTGQDWRDVPIYFDLGEDFNLSHSTNRGTVQNASLRYLRTPLFDENGRTASDSTYKLQTLLKTFAQYKTNSGGLDQSKVREGIYDYSNALANSLTGKHGKYYDEKNQKKLSNSVALETNGRNIEQSAELEGYAVMNRETFKGMYRSQDGNSNADKLRIMLKDMLGSDYKVDDYANLTEEDLLDKIADKITYGAEKDYAAKAFASRQPYMSGLDIKPIKIKISEDVASDTIRMGIGTAQNIKNDNDGDKIQLMNAWLNGDLDADGKNLSDALKGFDELYAFSQQMDKTVGDMYRKEYKKELETLKDKDKLKDKNGEFAAELAENRLNPKDQYIATLLSKTGKKEVGGLSNFSTKLRNLMKNVGMDLNHLNIDDDNSLNNAINSLIMSSFGQTFEEDPISAKKVIDRLKKMANNAGKTSAADVDQFVLDSLQNFGNLLKNRDSKGNKIYGNFKDWKEAVLKEANTLGVTKSSEDGSESPYISNYAAKQNLAVIDNLIKAKATRSGKSLDEFLGSKAGKSYRKFYDKNESGKYELGYKIHAKDFGEALDMLEVYSQLTYGNDKHIYDTMNWSENKENTNYSGTSGAFAGLHIGEKHYETQDVYNGTAEEAKLRNVLSSFQDMGVETVGVMYVDTLVAANSISGNEAVGSMVGLNDMFSAFSKIGTNIGSSPVGGMGISSIVANAIGGYQNDLPLSVIAAGVGSSSVIKGESLKDGIFLQEIDNEGNPVHEYYKRNSDKTQGEALENVISASNFANTVYAIKSRKTHNKTDDLLGKEKIVHELFYSDNENGYDLKYTNQNGEDRTVNVKSAKELFAKTGLSGLKGAVANEMSILRGNLAHAILAQFSEGGFGENGNKITNTEDLRTYLAKIEDPNERVKFLTDNLTLKSDPNQHYDVEGDVARYKKGFNTDADLINDAMGNVRSIATALNMLFSKDQTLTTGQVTQGFDFKNLNGGIFEESFQREYTIDGKQYNAVATIDSLFSALKRLSDYKTGNIYDDKVALQVALEKDIFKSEQNALKIYDMLNLGQSENYKVAGDDDSAKIEQARKFIDSLTPTVMGITKAGAAIAKDLPEFSEDDLDAALTIFANKDKFAQGRESSISAYVPTFRENGQGILEPNNMGRSSLNQQKWIDVQSLANDSAMTFEKFDEEVRKMGFLVKNFSGGEGGSGRYYTIDPIAKQKFEFTANFRGGKVAIDEDNWKTSDATEKETAVDKQGQFLKDLKEELGLKTEIEEINNRLESTDLSELEKTNLNAAREDRAYELDLVQQRIKDFRKNFRNVAPIISEGFEKNNIDKESIKQEAKSNVYGTDAENLNKINALLEKRKDLDDYILALEKQIQSGNATEKTQEQLEKKNKEKEEVTKELNQKIADLRANGTSRNADKYEEYIEQEIDGYYNEQHRQIQNNKIVSGKEAKQVGKDFLAQEKEISEIQRKIAQATADLQKLGGRKESEQYKAKYAEREVYYENLDKIRTNGITFNAETNTFSRMEDDGTGNQVRKDYQLNATDQKRFNQDLGKQMRAESEKNAQMQAKLAKPTLWEQFKSQWKGTMQYILMGQSAYMMIGKVTQALNQCIQITKQLDQTMTNLMVVTGKSKSQVKDMVKDYSKLADELGGTTQEIAASANEWLRMGYSVSETNELIKNSMMLSKLGMIETGQATEYLISAIKGYGVAVKDSSEIVDMATALDMKYAVSSGYILEGMSRAAASAKLAKVEMSDLQSMIAVVGETTQKSASSIGESFKTAFARYGNVKAGTFSGDVTITGENDEDYSDNSTTEGVNDIEKVLSKVGISLRESDLKTWRSYSDILKDIGKGWATYSDYEKNAITTAMFGTRQRENGLVVLSNYNRVLDAQKVAMSSAGTASKKYEAYQNSLEAGTKRLSAAWEQLVLDLEADGTIKDLSEALAFLVKHIRSVTSAILLMVAAFNIPKLAQFSKLLNKKTDFISSAIIDNVKSPKIKENWESTKNEVNEIFNPQKEDVDPLTGNTNAIEKNKTATEDNTKATNDLTEAMRERAEREKSKDSGNNTDNSDNSSDDATNKNVKTLEELKSEKSEKLKKIDEEEKRVNSEIDKNADQKKAEAKETFEKKKLEHQKSKAKGKLKPRVQKELDKKAETEYNQLVTDIENERISQKEANAKKANTERQSVENDSRYDEIRYQEWLEKNANTQSKETLDKKSEETTNTDSTSENKKNPRNKELGRRNAERVNAGEDPKNLPHNIEKEKEYLGKKKEGSNTGNGSENKPREFTKEERENTKQQLKQTVGTMMGTFSGMSLGGNIAEMLGLNSSMGSMIGMSVGTLLPSLLPKLVTGLSGPVVGAIMFVGAIGLAVFKHYQEEQLKLAKEAVANAEEAYYKATSQDTKDKVSRYDELVKGVDENGRNVSLSDDDYQEFLDISNELGNIYPQLVKRTDEFGNSLLGIRDSFSENDGLVGSIGDKVKDLNKELQNTADQKLLNPTYLKDYYKENLKDIKKEETKGIYFKKNLFSSKQTIAKGNLSNGSTIGNLTEKQRTDLNQIIRDINPFSATFIGDDGKINGNLSSEMIDEIQNYVNSQSSYQQALMSASNALVGVVKDVLPAKLRTFSPNSTDDDQAIAMNMAKTFSTDVVNKDNIDKYLDSVVNLMQDNHYLSTLTNEDIYSSYGQYQSKINRDLAGFKSSVQETDKNGEVKYNQDFENWVLATGNKLSSDKKKILDKDGNEIDFKDFVSNGMNFNSNNFDLISKIKNKNENLKNNVSDETLGKLTASQLQKIYSLDGVELDSFNSKLENTSYSINDITKALNEIKPETIYELGSTLENIFNQSSISKDISFTDWASNFGDDLSEIKEQFYELGDISSQDAITAYLDSAQQMADKLNIKVGVLLKNYKALRNIDYLGRNSKDIKTTVSENKEAVEALKEVTKTGKLTSENAEVLSKFIPDIYSKISSKDGIKDIVENGWQYLGTSVEVNAQGAAKSAVYKDTGFLKTLTDENRVYKDADGKTVQVSDGIKDSATKLRKIVSSLDAAEQIINDAGFGNILDVGIGKQIDIDKAYTTLVSKLEKEGISDELEQNRQLLRRLGKSETEIANYGDNAEALKQVVQSILTTLLMGIDINGLDQFATYQADIVKQNIDDSGFYTDEQMRSFASDYKSVVKAKEDEQKRKRDRKKELRKQAKEERDIERAKRDQINKESLQDLTELMERRNMIIESYNNKLNAITKSQDILDTNDYVGKGMSLEEQYDITAKSVAEAKTQFAELSTIVPKTSEEAEKLSSKMSELSSNIIEGSVSLHSLEKQMQENGLNALAKSIENVNTQYERQSEIISGLQNNLELDTGLVDPWDLAIMGAATLGVDTNEDAVSKKRKEYDELLELEDNYQEQLLAIKKKYLELLDTENAEANADAWQDIADREEELKDTIQDTALSDKWALIDYQETLENFNREHNDIITSMGEKWKNYSNMTIDSYTALKKFVDNNKLKIDITYSINGKKIPINDTQVSDNYATVLAKNGKKVGDIVDGGKNAAWDYLITNENEDGAEFNEESGLWSKKVRHGLYNQEHLDEIRKSQGKGNNSQDSVVSSVESAVATSKVIEAYNNVNPQEVVKGTSQHMALVSEAVIRNMKLDRPDLNFNGEKGWGEQGLVALMEKTLQGNGKGAGVFPKLNAWLVEQNLLGRSDLLYSGENGWGEDGLVQHIKDVLIGDEKGNGVFPKVNEWLESQNLLGAPLLKEDEWENLGKSIGEWISDGILQGVWDGEKRMALEGIKPSELQGMTDVGGKTVSEGGIPKGASVYFYSPHSDGGHVGIWDGNGKLYHNVGRNGKQGKIKLSSIAELEQEGYVYRGWGYNGGRQISSVEADNILKVAQNSSSYGINPIGGRCQAWVADVYSKALGTGRISAENAVAAGNQWIVGTTKSGTFDKFSMTNQDNGLMQIILQNLEKTGLYNKQSDWNPDDTTAARYIYDYLVGQGFTNKAIAAVLGNWQQESSLNPNKNQIGGSAYGIAQWDGGRKQRLFEFAKTQTPTMLQQLDWFINELNSTEGKSLKVLNNANLTLDEMTIAFEKAYERAGKPQFSSRTNYAQGWYDVISKYERGTNGHPGGPALVGEGKNSEIVSFPSGENYLIDKPTIFEDMPKGTEVVPIKGYEDGTDPYFPPYDPATSKTKWVYADEIKDIMDMPIGPDYNMLHYGPLDNPVGFFAKRVEKTDEEMNKDYVFNQDNYYLNVQGKDVLYEPSKGKINGVEVPDNPYYIENKDAFEKNNPKWQLEFQRYLDDKKDEIVPRLFLGRTDDIDYYPYLMYDFYYGKGREARLAGATMVDNYRGGKYVGIISNLKGGGISQDETSRGWKNGVYEDMDGNPISSSNSLKEKTSEIEENYKNKSNKTDNSFAEQLAQNINKKINESNQIYTNDLLDAKKNWGPTWEHELLNASSETERQNIQTQHNNSLKTMEMNAKRREVKIREEAVNAWLEEIKRLEAEGADSELISEAKKHAAEAYQSVTAANKEYAQLMTDVLTNLKDIYENQKKDIDYGKEMTSAMYTLGQMNDVSDAFKVNKQELLNYNDQWISEIQKSAKDRENTIRQQGIEQGLTEEQIKQKILNDEELRSLRQQENEALENSKTIRKDVLDNVLGKIDRSISKLDLIKPAEWTSRNQIGEHYSELRTNYDEYIAELEDYLKTAENLTIEEQEEIFDKINQYKKNNLEAYISEYSDKVAYQEKVYSALQSQVNLYIDNLNEEKEAVDKRYDEEIKKLQQVNTDKERSIKLTELQQNLENAEKQKKRVYRAGVGFVYEADRSEVRKAKQSLDSFYREDRINDLNTAKSIEDDFYQKRIDGWNNYLKAIDKVYEKERRDQNQELLMKELHVNSLEELDNLLINDRDAYVLAYAKHYERWSDVNFAYEGAWTPFLNEYESNLETLKRYQDEELKILNEKVKAYHDADFAGMNTTYSNPYETGRILEGITRTLEDGTLVAEGPVGAKIGDIIKTENGYFQIVPEGTGGATLNPVTGYWSKKIADNENSFSEAVDKERVFGQLSDAILANQDEKTKKTTKFLTKLSNIYRQETDIDNKKTQALALYNETLSSLGENEEDTRNQIISSFELWNLHFKDETKSFSDNFDSFITGLGNWNIAFGNKIGEILSLMARIVDQANTSNTNNNSSNTNSNSSGSNTKSSWSDIIANSEIGGDITVADGSAGYITSSDRDKFRDNNNSKTFNKSVADGTGYITDSDRDKFGTGKGKITKKANGDIGTTTKSFIAGEYGPEVGVLPDGTTVLYGANGPALYENQPLGTVIFPADQSSKVLSLHGDGTVNWDKYNNPQILGNNGYSYPTYRVQIPEMQRLVNNGQSITYDIRNVELPNVTDPRDFWKGLNEGVKRHMKDK